MRIAILLLFFCVSVVSLAFAHPPSDIKVNITEGEVRAEIMHSVADPAKHYIYEVTFSLNDVKLVEQKFDRQFDASKQIAVYSIPLLKKGDKLVVKADCNKGGDLSKEVTVE
jgi:hypothetical protein